MTTPNDDLAWWEEAFGNLVVGWTYRSSAQIQIGKEFLTVTPAMREWFLKPVGLPVYDDLRSSLEVR